MMKTTSTTTARTDAMFRFSWKWRRRSPSKVKERTHEEATDYTPEEKVAILRRHLLENEPISKLCDELGLQPTVFYPWQKEFFENGAAAFEQRARPNHSRRAGADRLPGEEDPDQGRGRPYSDVFNFPQYASSSNWRISAYSTGLGL
jgi:transposase-like protein